MRNSSADTPDLAMDSIKQTPEPVLRAITSRRRKWNTWLSNATFVVLASCYLLPFMRFVMSGSDEGSMLCGAERIAHGQLFARDFFEVMGPGTFYLLAIAFKAFGISFLVARLYLFLTLLGTAALMLFFSRRYCVYFSALPCIILAGTYVGVFSGGVSYHFDSNFYALLAVACVIWWRESSRAILLTMAGALLGVATSIFQPKGIAVFLATVAWLFLSQRKEPRLVAKLILLIAGYLSVIAMILVYFWSKGGLRSLIYADFTYPSKHYNLVNSVPYAFSLFKGGLWSIWLNVFGHTIWGVCISAILITPGVLIAILPFLTPIVGARHRLELRNPEVLLLVLAAYGLWLSEIHRADIFHLTLGAPLLIVLFFHYLSISEKAFILRGARLIAYFAGICFVVWSVAVVSLAVKTVDTPRGLVAVMQSHEASILEFMGSHVEPGEDIYVYPYSPIYYFLSGANNPTPYSFLMYGYNAPDEFQRVTRILDQRNVRYVVWDTNFPREEPQLFPRARWPKPGDLIMEPYLMAHYRKVADYGGVWIMERNLAGEDSGR